MTERESTTRPKRDNLAVTVLAFLLAGACIVCCIAYFSKHVATRASTIANESTAPSLEVTEWAQLPAEYDSLDVDDFLGKVLYIFCFQSRCPGCRSQGFPILQELSEHYEDDSAVAFMAIQTTFESFEQNTFENAQKEMGKFELPNIPVGQSSVDGQRSPVMLDYGTRGTPWVIMLDRKGRVAYNHFPLAIDKAKETIEWLKLKQ